MDQATLDLLKANVGKPVHLEFGTGEGPRGVLREIRGQFCLIEEENEIHVWVHFSHLMFRK
jgi:hypothetical protein